MSFNHNGGLDLKELGPTGKYICMHDSLLLSPSDIAHYKTHNKIHCEFRLISNFQRTLFSRPPHSNDIKQSMLGDCFLLVALLSIVDTPQGKEFINNMMCDTGHSILVRLFDLSSTPKKAIYIELDKTILYTYADSAKTFGHQAAWVYIIEKAFAVYRLKFSDRPFKRQAAEPYQIDGVTHWHPIGSERAPRNHLEALRGGKSSNAFEVILGKTADDISSPEQTMSKRHVNLFTILTQDTDSQKLFDSLPQEHQKYYLSIFDYARDDAQPGTESLAVKAAIDDYRRCLNPPTHAEATRTFLPAQNPRKQEVLSFIAKYFPALQPETRKTLKKFIIEQIPDKRGSKIYTSYQQNAYSAFHDALSTGKLVCFGINPSIGRSGEGYGISGEFKRKGLASNHAYQVLNCYERDGYKLVLVRNPWREYGREYIIKTYRDCVDGNWVEATKLCAQATLRGKPFTPVSSRSPNLNMAKPLSAEQFAEICRDPGVFELAIEDILKRSGGIQICDPGDWSPY